MRNTVLDSKKYVGRLLDRHILKLVDKDNKSNVYVNKKFSKDVNAFMDDLDSNRKNLKTSIKINSDEKVDELIIQIVSKNTDKWFRNTKKDLELLVNSGIIEPIRGLGVEDSFTVSNAFLEDVGNVIHYAVYIKIHSELEEDEMKIIQKEDYDQVVGTAIVLSLIYFINRNNQFSVELMSIERLVAYCIYFMDVDDERKALIQYMDNLISEYLDQEEGLC